VLLDAMTQLEGLDSAYNDLNCLPTSIAKLVALTSLDLSGNRIGAEGAQALKGLAALTSLDLSGNRIGDEGAQALKGLAALTSLDLSGNHIGDEGAQALKGLTALASLDLSGNCIGAEGAQALKGLTALASLDLACRGTMVNIAAFEELELEARDALLDGLKLDPVNEIGPEGMQALKGLTALTSLNLAGNLIRAEGVQALKGLTALTSLDLSHNDIGDEGARALVGLTALTSLNLAGNLIGDQGAQALKGLSALTSLDLSTLRFISLEKALRDRNFATSFNLSSKRIGTEGAQALTSLTALTSLDLRGNGIGAEGVQALKSLTSLTRLDLAGNGIGAEGLQALKGLTSLTSLDLSDNQIGPKGAQSLKGLVNLTSLNLRNTGVKDLSPLVSLCNLRDIDLSGNHLDHVVPEFWMLPSLREATLYAASLPGVPVEILSKNGDNCLNRLRAHLADLTGDDVAVGDVKLMILGNGRVGKTQICRRLRGESFDEAVPSTHGIQVSSLPIAPRVFDAPVRLKIWDFGGQDIYLGTHALFLKSRAIFPLVWTPKSEAEQFHTHGGFTFRNQPTAYWLAYVRTFGGAGSAVLLIQSQCDRPEDERDPPLPAGALDGFGYKKILHYGAKGDGTQARGHATLEETLLDAVRWMRRDQGVAKIGPGRAAVKAELEAKLAAGGRLISHHGYLDLCAEVARAGKGRISDPELLLDYLHNTGAVFYRKGLFADQIILDQAWALEAVYAVFDRASQSFKKIERNHGRFRRSELAEWVWQNHGVQEQELFLSFMQ
jgi:internalin A